jgi:hypothetical protein
MALTFPLLRPEFADILPASDVTFFLPEQMQQSRTAGGEQLAADMGERLWTGRINLGNLTRTEFGRPEALISVLRQAGRPFLMYDRRRPNPLLDPNGTILGASAVTILALPADPREIRLAGLPIGYTLSAGDYLSFSYTSLGFTRQALHKVVDTTVVAGGLGQTPVFEVIPAIRPGAIVGEAVTLRKPFCRAVMVAGSATEATGRSTLYEGLGFDWVQSLR